MVGVALLALPGAAQADGNGWYVGGVIGGADSGASQTSAAAAPWPGYALQPAPTYSATNNNLRPSLALVGGRMWGLYGPVSLGFEVEAGYLGGVGQMQAGGYGATFGGLSYSTDQATGSSNWSVPFEAAASLRLAYRLSPGLNVYGVVGPALGEAQLNTRLSDLHTYQSGGIPCLANPAACSGQNAYSGSASLWRFEPGLHLGVGLEQAIAPQTALRAEYVATGLTPIKQTLTDASNTIYTSSVAPRVQAVRFGVIHSF